jgi:DNA-binding Lrp family transcriptional regulator
MQFRSDYIALLEALYKNSRESATTLSETLSPKISRQTIAKLRRKLLETKIIHHLTVLVNPFKLNLQISFLEVKTNPGEPEILESFSNIPEIESIDGIIGDYALILKIVVATKKRFAEILSEIDQIISLKSQFQAYRIIDTIDIFKLGGFILENRKPEEVKAIDQATWELLQALRKNFDPKQLAQNSPLYEERNLSRKILRLKRDKIIQRFTITLDYPQSELHTKFYLRLKPKIIGDYSNLASRLITNPNIVELYRTGEEAGLLAIVRTDGLQDYKIFVHRLYEDYAIENTHTTVVLDENIPTIYPPTLKVATELCREAR